MIKIAIVATMLVGGLIAAQPSIAETDPHAGHHPAADQAKATDAHPDQPPNCPMAGKNDHAKPATGKSSDGQMMQGMDMGKDHHMMMKQCPPQPEPKDHDHPGS